DAGVPEQALSRGEGTVAELAVGGELPCHRVDDPLVFGFERGIFSPGDGVHHLAGHAVLAGHAGVRPPLELGLPPGAHGDDRDLAQPALDRGLEPQDPPERAQPPAGAWTNALNGPISPPSGPISPPPREPTTPSHTARPSASRSS